MDQWLIRTAENQLSGPFSKEEVKGKLLSGELKADDEIGPANSYWFSVYEIQEVRTHLGVDPPVGLRPGGLVGEEEVTATQITNPGFSGEESQSESQTTFLSSSQMKKNKTASAPASVSEFGAGAVPSSIATSANPQPAVVSARSASTGDEKSLLASRIEALLQWEGLRWLVTGATILLVYGLLRFWMN